jgi:hypothetical protein
MKSITTTIIIIFIFSLIGYNQTQENIEYFQNEKLLNKQLCDKNILPNYELQIFEENLSMQHQSKSSKTEILLLDSLIEYKWDTISNNWVELGMTYTLGYPFYIYGGKREFLYDTSGNISLLVWYDWYEASNAWIEDYRIDYSYDINGKLSTVISNYSSNHDGWYSDYIAKTEYSYDTNDNIVLTVNYSWDTILNVWTENWKTEFAYNEIGNIILETSYSFTSNIWYQSRKNEYSYDSNGNLFLHMQYHCEEGSNDWDNFRKWEYSYDDQGNQIMEIASSWFSFNDEWTKQRKNEYTYDSNGNLISSIGYDWDDGSWRETSISSYWPSDSPSRSGKKVYSYDSNGNLTLTEGYSWDDDDNEWFIEAKLESNYYEHENQVFDIAYRWNTATGTWSYDRKIEQHYSRINVTSAQEIVNKTISFHPNPATDFISFKRNESELSIFNLYDIQGRLVMKKEIHGNERLDIQHLKKGIYIYHLNQNGKVYNGKLIKK